jgi:hypothetical protein
LGRDRKAKVVCRFYLVGAVEYDIVFDSQRRYTSFSYHFWKPRFDGPIGIEIGGEPIPAKDLRLHRSNYKGLIVT